MLTSGMTDAPAADGARSARRAMEVANERARYRMLFDLNTYIYYERSQRARGVSAGRGRR